MDADIDELRDTVAQIISARMLEDLRCGRAVPWTSDVKLLPQGVQFRRARMLGLVSGPVEVLPYGQIRDATLKDGMFYLYGNSEAKPLLSKPVGSANFFPAYYTLGEVLGSATLGGQGAIPAEAVAEKTV